MQREESKHEKLEREQREREQMRQAIAAYRGPVTKCPPYKTTDPSATKGHRAGHDGMLTAGSARSSSITHEGAIRFS